MSFFGQKCNARGCKTIAHDGDRLCVDHYDYEQCRDCKKFISPRTLASKDGLRCGKCFDLYMHRNGGMYKTKDVQTGREVFAQFGFYSNATVKRNMDF
ncbi:MAG: hypothetical protein Terrestrivirus5_104 [Terrestrivirus sp.]|uniref:Uncharacterized protein n=1 Tax=Terrestrivirus sp. TaxID=2487775 RepID=A0A3G4ZN42_9VIRU|nr:MAG: hypothetical protein Terrestrivirus5_104 [Terrestrivirus sp.]